MATFSVFFSQCQRLQAKYTEFAGSCSREHLFVPSAVEFPCFAQMCRSTKNTADISLDGFVSPLLHLINLYIYFVGRLVFGSQVIQRPCSETDHFTPQRYNTPLFAPAGQRLQSVPSTKTHTHTHPLCPLTFDAHTLHTLPSNAARGVESLWFSLQGSWGQRGADNQRWSKCPGSCRRDVLKPSQWKIKFARLNYKALILRPDFFRYALCYITAVRCLTKTLSRRKMRS